MPEHCRYETLSESVSAMKHPGIRDYFKQDIDQDPTLTAKQRAILQASLDLFAEKGFEQTSTSDIAQRAGVAEGTVYRRYKTKEALREAVLVPLTTRVAPMLATDFSDDEFQRQYPSLKAFLTAIYEDRLTLALANQKEFKVILEMAAFDPQRRAEIIAKITPLVIPEMGKVLDQLKRDRLIVNWPDDLIIQTLLSMILGCLVRIVIQVPGSDLQREETYVIAVLMKILTPSAADDPALEKL